MSEYFIMSLKWTRTNEDSVTWWRANASGYTWLLTSAGRYTERQVRGNPAYYDNRENTIAVPCEVAERAASTVVLRDSSRAMLTEVLGRSAGIIGTTLYDEDHEGRNECPGCEHGYGHPGAARLIIDSATP